METEGDENHNTTLEINNTNIENNTVNNQISSVKRFFIYIDTYIIESDGNRLTKNIYIDGCIMILCIIIGIAVTIIPFVFNDLPQILSYLF